VHKSAVHGDSQTPSAKPAASAQRNGRPLRTPARVASRSPKIGDKYCTGGTTKGELCGWKVVAKGIHSSGGRDGDCLEGFTDIRLAEKALPGIVKKG
jgi:hypothetical protein